MAKTQADYEKILTESLEKQTLKRFANSLATLERDQEVEPRRVLVNGIVRPDEFVADFELQELGGVRELLEHFLDAPDLEPEIIINGIPGRPFDLRVSIGTKSR